MTANAGIDWPWLRRIRVTFSGLAGGGSSVFESDGTQEKYRAIVTIHKVTQALPSATNLTLYNLSPETRAAFVRGKTKIKIEAGWDYGPKSGLKQCFKGTFVTAFSQRAGADIVTNINALSAADDLAAVSVSKPWGPGTPVLRIVRELKDMLPGVSCEKIKGLDGMKVSDGGWSHCDTVRHAFDLLSAEFGFSWTIVDDCFQAIKDKMGFGGKTVIEDPELKDINPVFTGQGTEQTIKGLRIRSLFNADVLPMHNIKVTSNIEPRFNPGNYVVQTVDHSLDCFASESFMTSTNTLLDESTWKAVNGL